MCNPLDCANDFLFTILSQLKATKRLQSLHADVHLLGERGGGEGRFDNINFTFSEMAKR